MIYPTETAYAIGSDSRNKEAIRRIFALKGREQEKTFPLIAADRFMVNQFVVWNAEAKKLARKFWPGPLTLVLPVKTGSGLAPLVRKEGSIAVRVSAHRIARALAREVGVPIVSTSANRSGLGAVYSISALKKQFPSLREDVVILDAGRLPKRTPSTIVKFDPQPIVIRQGAVHI